MPGQTKLMTAAPIPAMPDSNRPHQGFGRSVCRHARLKFPSRSHKSRIDDEREQGGERHEERDDADDTDVRDAIAHQRRGS